MRTAHVKILKLAKVVEIVGAKMLFSYKTQSWAYAKQVEYSFLHIPISAACVEIILLETQTLAFCMNARLVKTPINLLSFLLWSLSTLPLRQGWMLP